VNGTEEDQKVKNGKYFNNSEEINANFHSSTKRMVNIKSKRMRWKGIRRKEK
jgi:hypothetical protein